MQDTEEVPRSLGASFFIVVNLVVVMRGGCLGQARYDSSQVMQRANLAMIDSRLDDGNHERQGWME